MGNRIVAPGLDADVQLDYVGSAENAAKVIAALYRGEKRLVFCDSKRLVEQFGALLCEHSVTTYLVHASLSLDERRRAERAFAEGRAIRALTGAGGVVTLTEGL